MTMPYGGGFSSFVIEMIKDDITIKPIRLKHEDINIRDQSGKNALYYAIESKNRKNIRILIQKNNISLYVTPQKNALFHAIECNNFWCVRYLIEEEKVDVNLKDQEDKTPLMYAVFYGRLKILKYLLRKGANIFQKSQNLNIPIDFALRTDVEKIQNILTEHIRHEMLKKDIIF